MISEVLYSTIQNTHKIVLHVSDYDSEYFVII